MQDYRLERNTKKRNLICVGVTLSLAIFGGLFYQTLNQICVSRTVLTFQNTSKIQISEVFVSPFIPASTSPAHTYV